MTRIGVRELRQNASRYLALVKAGETVEVTVRGDLIAVLAPPQAAQTARDRLIIDGRLIAASDWTGHARAGGAVETNPSVPTNAEILDAERAERL